MFTQFFRNTVLFPWRFFSKQHWLAKLLVVGVLVVVGVVLFSRLVSSNDSKYQLSSASTDSISETVSETGNVTAAGAAPVYSTTTGLVDEVMVTNGQQVSRGDELFSVVSTATKQERDTAWSDYLAAKSALETAKANQLSLQAVMFGEWDEFKELAESDDYEEGDGTPKYDQRNLPEFHVPEKEWLAAEAQYKKQQTVISQAAANVSAKWQAYQATQDSTVTAVLDGVVTNLSVTTGDRVEAASALTPSLNVPALVISSPGVATIIKTEVGETDIIKVAPGQEVTVVFDALPDEEFGGWVDRVDTVAVPNQGVVTYAVYVQVEDSSELLHQIRSGMTADVDILVAEKSQALVVPSSAVKPYQGGSAVRVVGKKGEIEYIPVKVGLRGQGVTEITSGIEPGQQVITALSNESLERGGGLL